jgi:hypothetical protein
VIQLLDKVLPFPALIEVGGFVTIPLVILITPTRVPVLGGQAVHEVCPVSELYVPHGHFWQTLIDVPLVPAKNVPSGHFRHVVDAPVEYVPSGQCRQSVDDFAPSVAEYVPGKHAKHP